MLKGLLEEVFGFCADHDVEVRLVPVERVYQSGEPCKGLFSDHSEGNTLIVACGSPDWYKVLAHEFGHCQQAAEGLYGMSLVAPRRHPKAKTEAPPDPTTIVDDWLYRGREVEPAALEAAFRQVIEMEMDAERRAVDLLTQHGVCRAQDYIPDGNAYGVRLGLSMAMRRFLTPPDDAAWREFLACMPRTFLSLDECLRPAEALREAAVKHLR